MDTDLENQMYPIGRFQRTAKSDELIQENIYVIKVLPLAMDRCIENLDAHQLQTPYRDGGWTVQQLVHHVADSHMNAYIRLKFALTEDNPTIMPYNEKLWAELKDTQLVPVNVSVTLLHAIHIRWVSLLENMTEAEWDRTYFHPQHQRSVPLWEMTAMYAWHSRHHTEHIRRLRERNGW